MNKKQYYDLMEEFGNIFSIPPRISALRDMLDMYPVLKKVNCEDALEWLIDRYNDKNDELQKKLLVKEEHDIVNLSNCLGIIADKYEEITNSK